MIKKILSSFFILIIFTALYFYNEYRPHSSFEPFSEKVTASLQVTNINETGGDLLVTLTANGMGSGGCLRDPVYIFNINKGESEADIDIEGSTHYYQKELPGTNCTADIRTSRLEIIIKESWLGQTEKKLKQYLIQTENLNHIKLAATVYPGFPEGTVGDSRIFVVSNEPNLRELKFGDTKIYASPLADESEAPRIYRVGPKNIIQ